MYQAIFPVKGSSQDKVHTHRHLLSHILASKPLQERELTLTVHTECGSVEQHNIK